MPFSYLFATWGSRFFPRNAAVSNPIVNGREREREREKGQRHYGAYGHYSKRSKPSKLGIYLFACFAYSLATLAPLALPPLPSLRPPPATPASIPPIPPIYGATWWHGRSLSTTVPQLPCIFFAIYMTRRQSHLQLSRKNIHPLL